MVAVATAAGAAAATAGAEAGGAAAEGASGLEPPIGEMEDGAPEAGKRVLRGSLPCES